MTKSDVTEKVHSFKAYLDVGSAYNPKVVPHKEQVTFLSKKTGLPQLWYWNAAEARSEQFIVMPDAVMDVSHSPNGDKIVIGMDDKGNEKQQLYLIDTETRAIEELMIAPEYFHHLGGWSPCGKKIAWSSNRRHPAYFDVFVQNVETKQSEVVYRYEGRCDPVRWLPDGNSLLIKCQEGNHLQRLYVLDLNTGGTTRLGFEALGRYESVQFVKDGSKGYLLTDAAENTMALYRFTWQGELTKLAHFPKWDIEEAKLSLDESRIAFTVNEGGISILHIYDVKTGQSQVVAEIPHGVIDSIAWSNEKQLIFGLKSPVLPGDIFRYNVETRSLERMTSFGQTEEDGPAWREPELRTFASFDGLEVPYFYYGQEKKKSPAVVYVHGGPESQAKYEFNAVVQYLAGQGFAVFVPNVRGSSGYGNEYMDLDNGRKRMDSVADLAWLVKDMARIDAVDSEKVGIIGRSYGGFMVLAALTQYPDLWAAGVDIVGISHFRTFLENTGLWRRKLREVEYGTLEDDSDFFEEIAPLNLSHKIKVPLLIFHGRNDTRVPVSESEQMYSDMRARGQEAELIVFEDEGHKTEKIENHILMNEKSVQFFRQHLEPSNNKTAYFISSDVKKTYENLLANTHVNVALEFIKSDNEDTLADQIAITEIPAPPFKEHVRAEYYKKRLKQLGLMDVKTDQEGNVFGVRPGTGNGPKLFVCAHLDTVFPEGTDTTVRKVDEKYIGPGIADDCRGLATVLSLVRAFNKANIQTKGDIVFSGVVGEEGLGDLRGTKAIFREQRDIDGFISIEPGNPSRTIYLGTGSRRYSITYKGPGGHSYGDFGLPSAIHALGRAITKISELNVPKDPKTTFTVGTISGGTSVNTIAAEAAMLLDLRSTSPEQLMKLEEQAITFVKEAAAEENEFWKKDAIQVDIKLVGDRPAGNQPSESIIVQAALASTEALGFEPLLDEPCSTDSNVPISLGVPAVTLGGGGSDGGNHTIEEWYDPTDAFYGVQKIFLTIIGLVGVENITEPLLQKKIGGIQR